MTAMDASASFPRACRVTLSTQLDVTLPCDATLTTGEPAPAPDEFRIQVAATPHPQPISFRVSCLEMHPLTPGPYGGTYSTGPLGCSVIIEDLTVDRTVARRWSAKANIGEIDVVITSVGPSHDSGLHGMVSGRAIEVDVLTGRTIDGHDATFEGSF